MRQSAVKGSLPELSGPNEARGLALRDFLAHPVVNQALDFRVGGWPLPSLRIGDCLVPNLPSGDDDFRRHTATAGIGDQAIGDEERSA